MIAAFEGHDWDWTYVAFRDSPYWDPEIPGTNSHTDNTRAATTDRKTLLTNCFLSNTPN